MTREGTIELMVARELDSRELSIDGVDWVLTILWERVNDRDVTFATWRRKASVQAEKAVEIPPSKVMDALEHPSLTFYSVAEMAQTS